MSLQKILLGWLMAEKVDDKSRTLKDVSYLKSLQITDIEQRLRSYCTPFLPALTLEFIDLLDETQQSVSICVIIIPFSLEIHTLTRQLFKPKEETKPDRSIKIIKEPQSYKPNETKFIRRGESVCEASPDDIEILKKIKEDYVRRKDYKHDWQHLQETSKSRWQAIPDTIGGRVRLSRTASYERINSKLQQQTAVCVLGDSGSGKSALTRRIAEQYAQDISVIWINAAQFDVQDFGQFNRTSLELENNWQTLADSVAEQTVLVVLDGIDRLFKPESLANFATFISSLKLEQAETPFLLLATCQPQRWDAVRQALLRHALNLSWQTCTLDNPTLQELAPLSEQFPQLHKLLQRVDLRRLLFLPKILDLLACSLQTASLPETRQWTGESDLIEWFWQAEIAGKEHGAMRERFLCQLAEQQALQLTQEISQREFATADLAILDTLEIERICYRKNGRIGFSHDLIADWSRQRLLLSETGGPQKFLLSRLDSPVWHRAIMLFGLDLLERRKDIETWASLLSVTDLLADLMLDAVIYAAHLESVLAKV